MEWTEKESKKLYQLMHQSWRKHRDRNPTFLNGSPAWLQLLDALGIRRTVHARKTLVSKLTVLGKELTIEIDSFFAIISDDEKYVIVKNPNHNDWGDHRGSLVDALEVPIETAEKILVIGM